MHVAPSRVVQGAVSGTEQALFCRTNMASAASNILVEGNSHISGSFASFLTQSLDSGSHTSNASILESQPSSSECLLVASRRLLRTAFAVAGSAHALGGAAHCTEWGSQQQGALF